VQFQALKRRARPTEPRPDPEGILLRATALFRADQFKDLQRAIGNKVEGLRHYDVLAMERIVAIVPWGRSGSVLLASYLDAHEDVIMLPELCGRLLHEFYERHPTLPLNDMLLAYPAYASIDCRFFEGAFAISSAEYYAAVQAIVECYGKWPIEFLKSRRAFFLFVHIAYNLALGRTPRSSIPLIVYAQHDRNNVAARHLVEDFPQAKFVHAVRDPISSCDALFHYHLDALAEHDIYLSHSVLDFLTSKFDRPHCGMGSRTWTIRFEDLHSATAETMRDLADWLGLPYKQTLLDSTFNGIPYAVIRDGKTWSGPRLDQVKRKSRYLSAKDRALLFALFHENFVAWKYPYPKICRYRIVRFLLVVSLVLFPMKTEIVGARAIFKHRILPSVRQGNIVRAIKSLFAIGFCRLKIMWLFVSVVFRRCTHRSTLLQVNKSGHPGTE
jgi:hypothetical protein